MDCVPISRSALQQLKGVTDEENRQKTLTKVVQLLYNRVIVRAKSSNDTCFKLELQRTDPRAARHAMPGSHIPVCHPEDMNFILDNKGDIIERLNVLFPDSTVSIQMQSRAPDGKYYDISTLDESMLKFIDRRFDQAYLIVDWS